MSGETAGSSDRDRNRWDYRSFKVTRAFSDWQFAERNLRAYLHFGLRLAADADRGMWEAATAETEGSTAEGVDRVKGGTFYRLKSPFWSVLISAYRSLGMTIDDENMKGARSVRHLLTHRAGALRTKKDAKIGTRKYGWPDRKSNSRARA